MIELYNFLESNSSMIVSSLVTKVTKEIPAYARVPRAELKQSLEYMLEAYTDLLVTGEAESQETYFKYLAKVRSSQSYKLSDIVQKKLCFLAVIRPMLQEHCRDVDGDGLALYNKAMSHLELTIFQSAARMTDVWYEYMTSRIDEHNEYLDQENQQLGVDLSKFILFRG